MAGTRSVYFDDETETIVWDYAEKMRFVKAGKIELSRATRALIRLADKGDSVLVENLQHIIDMHKVDQNKLHSENARLLEANFALEKQVAALEKGIIEVKQTLP